MRIRQYTRDKKTIKTDTLWKSEDLPPRHSYIFTKTRLIRGSWQWRSAVAESSIAEYVLLALINPERDNWEARLILLNEGTGSVISRYEYHGSHPGLHIHAHCERGGIEAGSTGMDNLIRLPDVGSERQVNIAFRANTFWERAKRHYRISDKKGPLL